MNNLFKRAYWYLFHHVFMASGAHCEIGGRSIKNCSVSLSSQSRFVVETGAQIVDSTIRLHDRSSLVVGKGVILRGVNIDLRESQFSVMTKSVLEDSKVLAFQNSNIRIDAEFRSKHIDMQVGHSVVEISKRVRLSDWKLEVNQESHLHIGEEVLCEKGNFWREPVWIIEDHSYVLIRDHNRLRNNIWARFGAQIRIGAFNCINEGSEVRADESVLLGDYNMISYMCRIWDTDTHSFYEDDTRRRMTKEMFPIIGKEMTKPHTKPLSIGNDCLIGEGALILKGSIIGNRVKVGARAIVSNRIVDDNRTIVCGASRVI